MDGIIVINKEKDWTSNDIVQKLKGIFHEKTGHTGTLDPQATGVLPVLIGKGTGLSKYLVNHDKDYIATIKLGKKTSTGDREGDVIEEHIVTENMLDEKNVKIVLDSFIGKQTQVPPMYSAIKVNGKKLYEYARNGEEVEIKERDIEIMMIQLISFDKNEIVFDVKCSKGTYIRSLCVDIAKKLGYPGHMSHLTRIVSGDFSLEKCYTLEDLQQDRYKLLSVDEALDSYPKIILKDPTVVYHGKMIKSDLTGQVAICDVNKHVLAIYESNGEGYLKNVRGLW